MADERKEKVIHTRIPAALEEQIKRLADHLRVPVSNVVRNMLEDALEAARRMRDRAGAIAGGAPAPAPEQAPMPAAKSPLELVFAWQEITLNVATTCARCEQPLVAGDEAYLGLSDVPTPRVFSCSDCLPQKRSSKPQKRKA
jgi:hypothetical protein